MAQYSSKHQVVKYLDEITKQFDNKNLDIFTTKYISQTLHLSRSLVSMYLNDMVKNGTAIKITSRPVYYLSKIILEKKYHVALRQSEYMSMLELRQILKCKDSIRMDFENVVGKDGSLHYAIQQIKSAIAYPGGLPILLVGENGTGKKYLGEIIYHYCINQEIIPSNAQFKYLKVTKQQKEIDYDLFLFGTEINGQTVEGIMDTLDHGILYIQNVSYLPENTQEKLADFLLSKSFLRKKGKKRVYKDIRIILSSIPSQKEQMCEILESRIPVVCNIPSFSERNEDEKKELILHFFYEEEECLGKNISISNKLLYSLIRETYNNNLTELKKCVKSICANAYVDSDNENLDIYVFHLPDYMLSTVKISSEEEKCMPLKDIKIDSSIIQIISLWNNIIHSFEQLNTNCKSEKEFLEESKKIIKHYYDVIVFQETYDDCRVRQLEKFVTNYLTTVRSSTIINFPINFAYVLARLIIFQQNHNSGLNVWEKEHITEITRLYEYLLQIGNESEQLCKMLNKQITNNYRISLSMIQQSFILLNMKLYNLNTKMLDTIGVVLCHGYSTASSIADAVNTLLNMQVFEAIDMPIYSSVDDTIEKLNMFVQHNRHFKNIILMVDMGSLEEIGKEIEGFANVGIINNISTLLALEIGNKIKQKKKVQTILEEVSKQAKVYYHMISIAKKDKAILFTSDAGISIAEKLCRLFKDSLPKTIAVEMIAYDYELLLQNGKKDTIFVQYNVELLVKPMNLQLDGVRNVTLEEIINFENINMVNEILAEYLSTKEIEQFDQLLLKNFSLQSIMENLTILNAQKLLDYVYEATNALQHRLKRKFLSKTIVGVNMHICFLIERLVTKKTVEEYYDIPGFINSNSEFIEVVNECFASILEHYKVTLPINEIAYLYEYIKNDISVKVGSDEF